MNDHLEELSSLRPGNKLNVILTTVGAECLVKAANGRTKTAMGKRANIINIGPLKLNEFKSAQEELSDQKICFQQRVEYSEDYRAH